MPSVTIDKPSDVPPSPSSPSHKMSKSTKSSMAAGSAASAMSKQVAPSSASYDYAIASTAAYSADRLRSPNTYLGPSSAIGNSFSYDEGMPPLERYGTSIFRNMHEVPRNGCYASSATPSPEWISTTQGGSGSSAKRWWRDHVGRFGTKRKANQASSCSSDVGDYSSPAMLASPEQLLRGGAFPAGNQAFGVMAEPAASMQHSLASSHDSEASSRRSVLSEKRLPKIPRLSQASTGAPSKGDNKDKADAEALWSVGTHSSTPAPNVGMSFGGSSDSGLLHITPIDEDSSRTSSDMSRSPSARGSLNSITMATASGYGDAKVTAEGQVLAYSVQGSSPMLPTELVGDDSMHHAYSRHFQPVPVYALNQFEPKITLGTGTFGRVLLVKHKDTDESDARGYMALKVLDKTNIVLLKQVAHINAERTVLSKTDHPFIVKLFCTYQDSVNCYMLMEFVTGGEVFTHLRKARRFPVSVTRFYIASLVLALSHLHSRHILYRDLKPENLLLDSQGYIKVADFGFAKELLEENERAWTLCGTPEYLSPEVIRSQGQTFASDYWALGILMFEMLCGYPPFYADRPFATYEKILQGKVQFPPHVDPVSRNLIQSLLQEDLSKRLGNLSGGAGDVMRHPWFQGVDWQALLDRRVPAPIVPKQARAGDTAHFQQFDDYDVDTMPGLQGFEDARAKMPAEAMAPYASQKRDLVAEASDSESLLAERDPYRHFFRDF